MKKGVLMALVLCSALIPRAAPAQSNDGVGEEFASDFKYLVDNAQLDAEDIITSPIHLPELFAPDGLFRKPQFYLTLAGVGAVFGGSFALDQTVRSHLRDMPSSGADALETSSDIFVGGWTGLLYAYGLYAGDERAREYALTSAASAGVSTLVTLGFKYAFGRLRPHQDHHSHTQFFDGGQSFVSGDATPIFALAAGVSEYYDNAWYAALPAYSGAMAVGFGRIGHDAHWLSDIAGAAIVGVGTTELLLYMHRRHAEQPSRWRIFPIGSSPSGDKAVGIGISYAF